MMALSRAYSNKAVFYSKPQKGQLLLPFFLLLFTAFLPKQAKAVQAYLLFDSQAHSETIPIKDAINDGKGNHFKRGERQWAWSWLELGLQHKHWGISLLTRYDFDLRFSEDTAELYWLSANKKDLPSDYEYQVALKANAVNASGLRIMTNRTLGKSVRYTLGLSLLKAHYLLDGSSDGLASVNSESDYDLDLAIDYHYTEDSLFNREVAQPEGKGFAIDASFDYQFSPATQLNIQVQDLLASIYWDQSPYTLGRADTDRKEYDENGYVKIKPTLTGFEGTDKQYKQNLSPRWHARINHRYKASFGSVFQYRYQYGRSLFGLGGAFYRGESAFSASYWPSHKALELSGQRHKLRLSLTADQLNSSELRSLWLNIAYGY